VADRIEDILPMLKEAASGLVAQDTAMKTANLEQM
jgi:hypothetical protein